MKLRNCIFAALFAALTFVATAYLQIPIPVAAGYVHLGDTFVFLAALMLPLPYAIAASAVGAALADVVAAYFVYAPATAVVKALMVVAVWLVCRKKSCWWTEVLSFVGATAVLALGYFVYEIPLYGTPTAVADLPFNLLQGAVCSVVAFALYKLIGERLAKLMAGAREAETVTDKVTDKPMQAAEPDQSADDAESK